MAGDGAERDFAKRTQQVLARARPKVGFEKTNPMVAKLLTDFGMVREGKNVIRKNEANRAELGTFEAANEILSNSDFYHAGAGREGVEVGKLLNGNGR